LFWSLLSLIIDPSEEIKIGLKHTPNEGISRSMYSGFLYGLFLGLLGGSTFGITSGFSMSMVGMAGFGDPAARGTEFLGRLPFGLGMGILAGLLFMVLGGFWSGWRIYLQHVALRFLLWRNGATPRPWEYVRFLDYASERVLLRKVGGGYIFMHRMLLEYFAAMDD